MTCLACWPQFAKSANGQEPAIVVGCPSRKARTANAARNHGSNEERGMNRFLGLVLLLPLIAGCGYSPKEQAVIDASLANESLKLWEQVDWRPSFQTARVEAMQSGKPIFVMVVVNKDGEKNAEFC
jgi:hypothetical protein